MGLVKTEGIILSGANWSESSQMLGIFTPDRGRLTLSIKGSRRINGRRGRPLRFARLEFSCYIKDQSSVGHLNDVDPVEVFMFEKDGQLGRLTFASAALELLANLLTDNDPQPACYQITLSFLRMTNSVEKKRLPGLFAGYILRLVSLLGYRPNLVGCAVCGKAIEEPEKPDASVMLSIEHGGVVCAHCRQSDLNGIKLVGISASVFRLADRLLKSSLEEASQTIVSVNDLHILVDLLTALLKYHSGSMKNLKSFDFLDKLARAVKAYGV